MGQGTHYFCAAAEFIASAEEVTVGSSDYTVCVDVTHLRSAPRTAHPLAPNALKIYRHSSSCIAPVLGISYSSWGEGIESVLTSFDDKALLVKSLQHDVKQRSKRFEYIRIKSCI